MSERSGFIDVEKLMPEVRVEQVLQFYGVGSAELERRGDEIRAKCFLQCGFGGETGPRALAINAADPTKKWKCHQYGCDKAGNLVSLCDLLKAGANAGGRPRGERFKEILKDLQAMASGVLGGSASGEALSWIGRDTEFEKKHADWAQDGNSEKEPEKFDFVKGFHRGLEVFGQHGSRLKEPGYRESLKELGVIVVEGPNDVMRLD